MTDRNKPTAGFWITVALVAVLVYPLSFGPACWITSRLGHGAVILPVIYWPIIRNMEHSTPNWFNFSKFGGKLPGVGDTLYHSSRGGVINWYACLLAAEGWQWYCVDQYLVIDLDRDGKWEWRSLR